MTWFKISDSFHDDRKVIDLLEHPDGLAAIGLWVLAGSWCSRHLTDGNIPAVVVRKLCAASAAQTSKGSALQKIEEALVSAKLWVRTSSRTYKFTNWEKYNPTRDEVEARMVRSRERAKKSYERRHSAPQKIEEPKSSAVPRPDPTRPLINPPQEPPPTGGGPPRKAKKKRAPPRPQLPALPDDLAELAGHWDRWVRHRREIKKPLRPTQCETQFARLRAMGVERARAAIDYTIGQGWQGLREPERPEQAEVVTQDDRAARRRDEAERERIRREAER